MEKMYKFDRVVIDGAVNGAGKVTLWWAWAKERFDVYIIDGAVNGAGWIAMALGKVLRRTQTGQVQTYAMVIFLGAVILIFWKII